MPRSGPTTNAVKPGRYRHYKGKEYTVLGVARHSETQEELVVYRQEYGERGLWVRPLSMFLETVTVDGQEAPRFRHLEAAAPAGVENLLAGVPSQIPEEILQTLVSAPAVRIERILSQGHASPEGFWYDQEQHEWVVVLMGSARLRLQGQELLEMGPGDFIHIPAHQKHRVEWTTPDEPTVWLAVHYGEPQ